MTALAQSYVHGASSTPLLGETIGALLQRVAEEGPQRLDPAATLEAVQAEGCTGPHGVPTMFIAMLDHPEFGCFDLTTLRTGIMAGSPCPVEVMRRVIDRMHMREVTSAYE